MLLRNFFVFIIMIFSVGIIAGSALATRWPDNYGWRVLAMGGADLAIEDETTELNLFNYGNPAGMAYLPKQNRLDISVEKDDRVENVLKESSVSYICYCPPSFSARVSNASEVEVFQKGKFQINSGSAYRGLMYWVLDNLVIRMNSYGSNVLYNAKTVFQDELANNLETTFTNTENASATLIGAELDVAWEFTPRLSVGGRILFDKPIEDARYRSQEQMLWSAALAYHFDKIFVDNYTMSVGLNVGRDTDNTNYYYDVSFGHDFVSAPTGIGPSYTSAPRSIFENTTNPFKFSTHMIAKYSESFSLGVGFEYEDSETLTKRTDTNMFIYQLVAGQSNPASDYTEIETYNRWATVNTTKASLNTLLKIKIPISDSMELLMGIRYGGLLRGRINEDITNTGTRAVERTYGDGTLETIVYSDPYTTRKNYVTIAGRSVAFAQGIQLFDEKLQMAVQVQHQEMERSDENRNDKIDSKKIGGEYRLFDFMAIRMGYNFNNIDDRTISSHSYYEHIFSTGVGWDVLPEITLNISATYSWFDPAIRMGNYLSIDEIDTSYNVGTEIKIKI